MPVYVANDLSFSHSHPLFICCSLAGDCFVLPELPANLGRVTHVYSPAPAQNQCQLVILLAEARIGAELVAAQERGEIAQAGGDQRSINARASGNGPATLPDIGIPSQRAAEYKVLIGPAVRPSRRMDSRKLMPSLVPAERPGQNTTDRSEVSSKSQVISDASAIPVIVAKTEGKVSLGDLRPDLVTAA